MANLAGVMEERARKLGYWSAPAFVVGGRTWTHGEVHRGAALVSARLAGLGVNPGDRVLVVLADGIEFVWTFLGAIRLGALAVLANPRLTADDHADLAADARPGVAVVAPDIAGHFAAGGASLLGGVDLGAEVIAALEQGVGAPGGPAIAEADDEDAAYAQYTSGTTGRPKAAVHRHRDPQVYFSAFARGAVDLGGDDVVYSVSKMFFAYGLGNSLFFPLLAGCRAVLDAGPPRPDTAARLVRDNGVTVMFSVPTFYARLVAAGDQASYTSVRAAVSAGEALTPVLAKRVVDFLGCPILDGLGSTEVGQTFVSNTLEHCRDGTVGRALPPYEVVVRDESGNDLDPGRPGTLWVRGPTVLVEYLGHPEATAAAVREGWLCTADRAMLDADGFVHHLGRVDDIEVVGGINVAPLEVEAVLVGHPGVTEVAVAAVRHATGASRLEAFVVTVPGLSPDDGVADELVALAKAELAPHKVPRAVHLVDALPRTPTGKLRRFLLRQGTWTEAGASIAPPGPGSPPNS
ncbi:MAG TPA: AMP-binding protein [Acidimicrobiales bacterium]|jgi:acyl-coenzyme A synthetase/AMP-(fatty) acid ligase|nr:AMP-binding protein [Acidimicrobiales bacterium]